MQIKCTYLVGAVYALTYPSTHIYNRIISDQDGESQKDMNKTTDIYLERLDQNTIYDAT